MTCFNIREDQRKKLKERNNMSFIVRKAIELYCTRNLQSIGYQNILQETPEQGTGGNVQPFNLTIPVSYLDLLKPNRSACIRHALDVFFNCEYLGVVEIKKSKPEPPKPKRLTLSKDRTKCLINVMISKAQKNWMSVIQNGASEIRIALYYYIESYFKNNPAFNEYLLDGMNLETESDNLERFSFYLSLDVYHFCMSKGLDLSEITRDALDAFFMWQYETGDKKVPATLVSEDTLKKHRVFLIDACKGEFLTDKLNKENDPSSTGDMNQTVNLLKSSESGLNKLLSVIPHSSISTVELRNVYRNKDFDPLGILMGTVKPKPDKFQKEKKQFLKTIDKEIKKLSNELKKWTSKKYKSNPKKVSVGGHWDNLNSGVTSIGAANERRKKSRIDSLSISIQNLKSIKKDSKKALDKDDIIKILSDFTDSRYAETSQFAEKQYLKLKK